MAFAAVAGSNTSEGMNVLLLCLFMCSEVSGLCGELITRSEGVLLSLYVRACARARVCVCVCVCDPETSAIRWPRPELGIFTTGIFNP